MILNQKTVVLLSLLLINTAPGADAADSFSHSQLQPHILLREEYNDNLNLTPANKQDDYITTVQPGIRYSNMDQASGIELDYLLGLVAYGKNSHLNYISHNAYLTMKYLSREHVNFFFKESFIRSDEPREREYFTATADNRFVLATISERAVYWRNVAAPTIEYQFGPENRLGLNYRNNIYRTASTISQDSQEDYLNPYFSYWFDKQNGISLEYGLTYGDFQADPRLTGHLVSARYTRRFSVRSSLFTKYTFSRRNFAFPGVDYDIHEPAVGFNYALSPLMTTSAEAGYYQMDSEDGTEKEGFSYTGVLRRAFKSTTYQLSLQGGYTEDYFTSQNLGFNRYHRLTGSLQHLLNKRMSIGGSGSIERAQYNNDREDTILGISGIFSHVPLKWLTLALEVSFRDNRSTISAVEYTEKRGAFTVTATY